MREKHARVELVIFDKEWWETVADAERTIDGREASVVYPVGAGRQQGIPLFRLTGEGASIIDEFTTSYGAILSGTYSQLSVPDIQRMISALQHNQDDWDADSELYLCTYGKQLEHIIRNKAFDKYAIAYRSYTGEL